MPVTAVGHHQKVATSPPDPLAEINAADWNADIDIVITGLGTAAEQNVSAFATASHNHAGVYEPANSNIQAHVIAAHAPAGATVNSADAFLLARANHTGTQASTTIVEDSTHRFATDAEKTTWNAKESTANKGVANGYAGLDGTGKVPSAQLPASGGGMSYVKLTGDAPAFTTTTLGNITGLSFAVVAGTTYRFTAAIVFRSAATTTGAKLGLTCPAFSVLACSVRIPAAADGVAGEFQGWITSSGDSVIGSGVQAINTDYMAIYDGVIVPSANGTVQLQAASETGTANVIVRTGSNLGWIAI